VSHGPVAEAGVHFNIVHLKYVEVLGKIKGIKAFLLYTWWKLSLLSLEDPLDCF
jgi:hypothetical protein